MKFIVNTNLDGMSWIDISIYNNEKLLKNEQIMTLKEVLDFSEEKKLPIYICLDENHYLLNVINRV